MNKRPYTTPRVKRLYTIPELAEMCDLSPRSCARMLDGYGVEYIMVGRKRLVPLGELAEKLPGLAMADRWAKALEKKAALEAACEELERRAQS